LLRARCRKLAKPWRAGWSRAGRRDRRESLRAELRQRKAAGSENNVV
jgi:hypothetical protein